MISRLSNFIKFLIKVKILLKKPSQSDVIVIDSTSILEIKNVLKGFDWEIVETRNELIKEIYITPKMVLNFFLNLKDNFKIAYLTTLIQEIRPKIVLTFIDNSFHFSRIAKNFRNKKINFFAIQNAWRGDISENDYFFKKGLINKNPNKILYIPSFFCLGKNDIKKYKKYKIDVKKFFKVGSLRLYNAIQSNIKKNKKKYDICLISNTTWDRELTGSDPSFACGYVKLVKYLIRFVREKKLKLIFCLKSSNRSIAIQDNEISILRKNLSADYFNYLKKNSTYKKKENYLSYKVAFSSNVVVGVTSTILGECLSYGKKVLACNFSNLEYCDFPIKGICFSKNKNYNNFSKQLKKIINCSDDYYQKRIKKKKNYIVNYNKNINPNIIIQDYIKKTLKNYKQVAL